MGRLGEVIRELPGVRRWRMRSYDRFFENNVNRNLFRGVYSSFDRAVADLPVGARVGYDQLGASDMYRDFMKGPREWDYPVLYWLDRQGSDLRSVFDHGGHVGLLYYALRRYLRVGEGFKWVVQDVPSIVQAGRQLALEQSVPQLQFTENFGDADAHDFLLSSGALQYIEEAPDRLLGSLRSPPTHAIINMLPVHAGEDFVTVSSMGVAFCPYKVRNRKAFLDGMRAAGWSVCDEWKNLGKSCVVPFHERYDSVEYYGWYFQRR